jgi:ABC-type Mn2+/Zn2+ transport system permease subunit
MELKVIKSQVFVIRAILGVGFGVALWRLFYPKAPVGFVIGLCATLVALAYLTEYLRNRSKARSQKTARIP